MSGFKSGSSNYNAPAHKSTLGQKANMGDGDAQGVKYGLSALQEFDAESHGPSADYDTDPMTGNATERTEPYQAKSASKFGESFSII